MNYLFLIGPIVTQFAYGLHASSQYQAIQTRMDTLVTDAQTTTKNLTSQLDVLDAQNAEAVKRLTKLVTDTTQTEQYDLQQLRSDHRQHQQRLFIVSALSLLFIFFIFFLKITLKIVRSSAP